MPNHTDNRVILSHDDSQQIDMIYNIMNTEDTPLCQTLIPMDEKLLEISGISDNYEVQGWYEWRLENWGTKWGTYSHEREAENIFVFETAWSAIPNLVRILAESYSDFKFIYEYADEDTGHNVGYYEYFRGVILTQDLPSGSKQAYELAFKLRPYNRDSYKLVGGNYQYDEDSE